MWFEYRQNNSGGSFVSDQNVAHSVWVEADSHESANEIAKDKGIYFDGVEDDRDCPCCGDRWWPCSDSDSEDVPSTYVRDKNGDCVKTTDLQEAADREIFCEPGENAIILYHASGDVERFAKRKGVVGHGTG